MDALENVRMERHCRDFRYRGRLLVRMVLYQPIWEEKTSIHAFYQQMCENLWHYAEEKAENMEKMMREGTREQRMALRELFLKYQARVMYADDRYVSILWEISRNVRGERPACSYMAQTFSLEREILLPVTAFVSEKKKKISPDAPYYLSEKGVVFL